MQNLILEDPNSVRQSIRAAIKLSQDQHLLHELHCVLLVGLGRSCHEVAGWFGDSTRTIERWVGAFNRCGVEGLCAQRSGGRTSRLPAEAAQRVAFELKQPPCVCGFPDARWGGRLLMQHLQAHYGVTMSLRQCQRTMRRLRAAESPRSRDWCDTVLSLNFRFFAVFWAAVGFRAALVKFPDTDFGQYHVRGDCSGIKHGASIAPRRPRTRSRSVDVRAEFLDDLTKVP